MFELKTVQRTLVDPSSLKAPENVLGESYSPLVKKEMKGLKRESYTEFSTRLRKEPVRVMLEASDVDMSLEQYANFRCPEILFKEKRSVLTKMCEEDALFLRTSRMSASSEVHLFMDGGYKQAVLYGILSEAWDNGIMNSRAPSLQLEQSQPVGTPPSETAYGTPPPVAAGVGLNPGELISNTHGVNTNNYSPYAWSYNKEDMERTAVNPGSTIPPSTLGEATGNIPMQKWGNRFRLPYEMLVGGQGMRINKLASMVQLDALTESTRQFDELIEVLEKGDGVTTAATIEGISTYDGTAGSFGFVAFLNWLDEALDTPFQISHVIMLSAQQRQLRTTLASLEGNLAFEQLSRVGLAPNRMGNMEPTGNIRYGRANPGALTASYVLGIDSRYAVEKVNRAGLAVREQARHIANQTEEVVISDTYLLARVANEAVKVLNIAA